MTPHRLALERFATLVADDRPPLAESGALIAAHLGAPGRGPSVEGCLADLDALAVALGVACGPHPTLDDLIAQMHGPFGFRGNRDDYYDPRNSLLPEVLRRRTGMPLTLAMVVVEVAVRLGVAASVVGMPGHVLVGDGPRPHRWLDPFEGGGWLDESGAAALFVRLHGTRLRFDRAFLAATPPRLVLVRLLENLVRSVRGRGDLWGVARALELRARVPGFGERPAAQIELAEAYAAVGRWADAVSVLEVAAAQLPPNRREQLEARARRLRALAN